MSDRTSAEIFAIIFEELAKNPTEEHKAIARKIWPKRTQYDFSDYQMYCDEALVKLGLAAKVDDSVSYAD